MHAIVECHHFWLFCSSSEIFSSSESKWCDCNHLPTFYLSYQSSNFIAYFCMHMFHYKMIDMKSIDWQHYIHDVNNVNHPCISPLVYSLTSQYPYYTFVDRSKMYTVGSLFYAIYFFVSFPMFYRMDEVRTSDRPQWLGWPEIEKL
jgi:hypothetical protein